MRNEVARRIALDQLREDWKGARIELIFPEGAPDMEAFDSMRITDPSVIVRTSLEGGARAELVTRR